MDYGQLSLVESGGDILSQGGWLRSSGLSDPNRVLYQAELHPEDLESRAVTLASLDGSQHPFAIRRYFLPDSKGV